MVRGTFGLVAAMWLALAGQACAAPPLEAYGRLPAIEKIQLSPSGERIAFIIQDHGVRRLMVRTLAGQLLQTAAVGDTKIRDLDWAGDEHVLVTFSATVDLGGAMGFKNELFNVLVMPLNGNKPFGLFQGHPDIAMAVAGVYRPVRSGDRWYGYFRALTLARGPEGYYLAHGYADLYRVDLDTGAPLKVAVGYPDSDDWALSSDGAVVARSYYDEDSGAWKITKAGGGVLLAGKYPRGGATLLGLGRTPGVLLVDVPNDPDDNLVELPLSGGPAAAIPDGQAAASEWFDSVSRLWIGTTVDADESETSFFDPRLKARIAGIRKAFPGRRVELASASADFGRLVVRTDGTGDSGSYWLITFPPGSPKGSAESLGMAYPEIADGDVGPVRMIAWKAADGLEVHGVLTLPPGREARNLPLVVLPHGGPQARDYPQFDWWAQAFASRGYAVLQPNFRGSDGYGGKFVMAGWGEWGRKMQTDVSDGVAALAAQGLADPKRACIVGASYGGYVALAGVTIQQGLYRCAVSVAGVSDLDAMLNDTVERRGGGSVYRYWRTYMGAKGGVSTGLHDLSPAKLAERADAPILLIHGKDDTVVPIEQSREMERALKGADKPVEFVLMPQEDHWLSHEATRTLMLKSAVAFVEKHNPPDAALAPAK